MTIPSVSSIMETEEGINRVGNLGLIFKNSVLAAKALFFSQMVFVVDKNRSDITFCRDHASALEGWLQLGLNGCHG